MRRFIPTSQVRRFLPAQEGATSIEYALIASGIGGLLVAVVTSIGDSVTGMWTAAANIFH